jgi:hypothetical protein
MDDLLTQLRAMVPAEVIDGSNVDDAAEAVDLSIAYTPVVEDVVSSDLHHRVVKPVEVQKWSGGRWAVMYPERKDFRRVTEGEVKRMRARYLLLRGFYTRHFRRMPYPVQEQVRAWYFPDGLWLPPEASELAKAMGVEG